MCVTPKGQTAQTGSKLPALEVNYASKFLTLEVNRVSKFPTHEVNRVSKFPTLEVNFLSTLFVPRVTYSIPGFLLFTQYLAGCRELNPSCCNRSQVCY